MCGWGLKNTKTFRFVKTIGNPGRPLTTLYIQMFSKEPGEGHDVYSRLQNTCHSGEGEGKMEEENGNVGFEHLGLIVSSPPQFLKR